MSEIPTLEEYVFDRVDQSIGIDPSVQAWLEAITSYVDTYVTPHAKEAPASSDGERDLLEWAWSIIANAGSGNWELESKDWQEAAAKWRDEYHSTIAPSGSEVEVPVNSDNAENTTEADRILASEGNWDTKALRLHNYAKHLEIEVESKRASSQTDWEAIADGLASALTGELKRNRTYAEAGECRLASRTALEFYHKAKEAGR